MDFVGEMMRGGREKGKYTVIVSNNHQISSIDCGGADPD
jgi:hypothetical protein